MEALILLGVLGAGYFINEDKEKTNNVYPEMKPPLFENEGNTIYEINNYKDAKKYEIDKVIERHDESLKGDSKIIDATNMDGRNTLRDGVEISDTIKSITGNTINKEDFLINDQGIKIEPFYSGSGPTQTNFDDTRGLERHQGGHHSRRNSRPFDPPSSEAFGDVWTRNSGNVHGNTFSGARSDQSRYIAGNNLTNELPFEQERISHIDQRSNINGDIDRLYAERNNIDNIRTLNNQKVSFEGKILSGKDIEKRGEIGQIYKHTPNQDYVQSADQWLVTTGAIDAPRIRPTTEFKETNRQYLNDVPTGIAAPVILEKSENRPLFKKSTNQQFLNDTNRNISLENRRNDDDHNKSSFFVYPNEREITSERTHQLNVKSIFQAETERLKDEVKPTVKETTLDDTRNGFVGPTVTKLPEERLQDNVRPTKKDTTLFEYSGNAGTSSVVASMASDQYLRADLNPNKEVISRGREPTPENTKLANGMDTVNLDIKKIESDYFNPRINNADKIYQEIPQDTICEYTQDKDTLDNVKLSDRLDPNMLDPFRQNPYTQSLSSFA